MIKISEGQHRMLDDKKCGKLVIANILAYLKGEFWSNSPFKISLIILLS